jgi:dihydropteroate synthase
MPDVGRCLVMGVVNVTPDSFSDGGQWFDPAIAVRHGLELVEQGADIVDVGGESTRPGAARVSLEEELARVEPVIRELSREGVTVSVDTMRAEVAQAAVEAGAKLVNDVSGGLADEGMARLVAEAGVPWVLMHWRGHSREMYAAARYGDVVTEVCAELTARVEDVVAAGVAPEQLVLDPGIGFAKNAEHNWALLAGLDRLIGLGLPVLLGTSRKTFLGRLLAGTDGELRSAEGRDAATLATTVLAAEAGAWGVRVHDAAASVDAVRTVQAVRAARGARRG